MCFLISLGPSIENRKPVCFCQDHLQNPGHHLKERNDGEEKENHQGKPQGLHQLPWISFVCFFVEGES